LKGDATPMLTQSGLFLEASDIQIIVSKAIDRWKKPTT
jgi:hypothetical protein